MAARAEELALRALEGDSSLGEAYLAVATLRRARRDYRAAVRSMRQALERSPAFGPGHHLLGRFLCQTGHLDEGQHRLEVGARLGERSAIAQAVELRVRALLGQETRVREHLARLKSEGLAPSLAQTTCELAIWWNDRALAEEAAGHFEQSRSGAVWQSFAFLLRAFSRGDEVVPRRYLLWLERAPSLATLRGTAELATARAKVAMRVSEIGL